MATFSVDITDVVFAAARTGYKDITITGMPAGGVTVSLYGDYATYFTCTNNPESKGTNVYRVSTKSTNTSSADRTANLKITNTSDSTDYVYVSLKQYSTFHNGAYVIYVISNYSDIYAHTYSNETDIYFPYSLSDSTAKVELYVDGSISEVKVPSWASYVNETTYTDTGFSRLLISCTNNYDGPRVGNIKFRTSTVGEIYQNGYPSSTSGCTQSLSFLKSGGTQTIELKIPSTYDVSDINYSTSTSGEYMDPLSISKISGTRLNYSVTVGNNNTGNDLDLLVKFTGGSGSSSTYLGHTIVTQSAEDTPISTLTVDPTSLTYPASGGAIVLDVTYSGTLTTSEFPSWLTYETVNVDSTHRSYTITASKNSSTSSRSFNLELSNGTDTVTVPVTQSAEDTPISTLTVDPTSLTYPASGGAIVLDVTYSGTLTTSEFPSWLTYETVNVDSTHRSYTITASKNSSTSSRSFNLELSNGTDTVTVPVTQAGAEAASLTISPTEASVGSGAGTTTVTVTSTGIDTVEYSIAEGWVSLKTQSSNVYTFSYTANTASSQRSCIITFYGGGLSKSFVINQAAGAISVSPVSNNVDNTSGTIQVTVTGSSNITYSISGSWLTYQSKSGNVYTFAYTQNSTSSQRTATVTFSASGMKDGIFTLTQAGTSVYVPGSFKVYPKKLRYYGEGGSIRVSFTNRPEGGIGYEIIYTDGSDWLSVRDSGPDKYVTATKNSGIRRRASIKFYDVNDSKKYVVVPVIQGNIDGYDSIWMDDLYYPENRNESGNYYYRLVDKKTNAELFTGISTIPPGWSGNIGGIDIPRLVDGHIHSLLFSGSSSDWSDMYESYITVDIYNMTGSAYPGVVDATFKYCNDWSRFEKRYDYTRSLNDPINGKGCDDMIIPFCVYYDDEATFSIVDTEKNGNVNTYTLPTPSTPFAMRIDRFYDTKKLEYKQDDEVIFTYDMDHCGSGAFIYRNRFGSWDSFLIEGNIIKTDNYTKLNYRTKGEYNQMYDFRSSKYMDEKHTDNVSIDTTYEAYTGWLSDEEAERLVFHLLSSPIVYFQDLNKENQLYDTDQFTLTPVRLTTSSAEYKKFRNGKKMVNYLITFEKSNTEKVRD